MLEVYVTRHGETQWNKEKRMQGQGDSLLTEYGKEQGTWLGERLKGKEINYIYVSPLGRAKETISIISKYVNAPIIEDDALMEIKLGPWEGMTLEEIQEKYPLEYDLFWNKPELFKLDGVESFKAIRDRAGTFIERLLKEYGDGKILIVTHAAVIKAMLSYVQGMPINDFWSGKHIHQTSLTKLNAIDDRINVVYMSNTSHFKDHRD